MTVPDMQAGWLIERERKSDQADKMDNGIVNASRQCFLTLVLFYRYLCCVCQDRIRMFNVLMDKLRFFKEAICKNCREMR